MTTDTIFSIAPMTQPMVAVAALALYEEGALLAGDPVGKFPPELAAMQVGVVKYGPDAKPVVERIPARRQMEI